jgi:hypothetical protein
VVPAELAWFEDGVVPPGAGPRLNENARPARSGPPLLCVAPLARSLLALGGEVGRRIHSRLVSK